MTRMGCCGSRDDEEDLFDWDPAAKGASSGGGSKPGAGKAKRARKPAAGGSPPPARAAKKRAKAEPAPGAACGVLWPWNDSMHACKGTSASGSADVNRSINAWSY
jgi:hypothetical protein